MLKQLSLLVKLLIAYFVQTDNSIKTNTINYAHACRQTDRFVCRVGSVCFSVLLSVIVSGSATHCLINFFCCQQHQMILFNAAGKLLMCRM
jgi:hypothetical protein